MPRINYIPHINYLHTAIEDCGFDATLSRAGGAAAGGSAGAALAKEAAAWRRRLLLGAVLATPVFVIAMASMVPAWMPAFDAPLPYSLGLPWSWLVQAVLSSAVQFAVGGAFYRSAWAGLRRREPNMQVRPGLLRFWGSAVGATGGQDSCLLRAAFSGKHCCLSGRSHAILTQIKRNRHSCWWHSAPRRRGHTRCWQWRSRRALAAAAGVPWSGGTMCTWRHQRSSSRLCAWVSETVCCTCFVC